MVLLRKFRAVVAALQIPAGVREVVVPDKNEIGFACRKPKGHIQLVAQKAIGCFSGKKQEELFASCDFEHSLGTLPMS